MVGRLIRAVVVLLAAVSLGAPAWGAGTDRDAVRTMVAGEAREMDFPVALALAVAHAESNFDAGAESNVGARGVMQIMPATAASEYAIHPDLLWDARINIRLGIHFLDRLLKRYHGRTDLALSFYNGGSRVGNLPNARVIPATYGYVHNVLVLEQRYQRQIWQQAISDGTQRRPRRHH